MFNHAPVDYFCLFCSLLAGEDDKRVYSKPADIIYQDDFVTAFIASHQLKNNPGLVIVIPNEHVENIYDLPDELSAKIHQLEKRLCIAVREAYPCVGNVIRQHNEPIEGAKCKGQDVLHYHLQIIPRYSDDRMYEYAEDGERYLMPEDERRQYVELLRDKLAL
ncbi:MAG: diadenosine tetraphosphate hydrolase [Patescibacteria group bacterium]|nr:diadenosine tetraphosphate hydrolase [Patescibacteria group bacterium]